MFFWNSLAFSMIHWMLATWSLVPLPFLIQLVRLEIQLWRIRKYRMPLLLLWARLKVVCEVGGWNCNCAVVWAFFALPFFGIVCICCLGQCLLWTRPWYWKVKVLAAQSCPTLATLDCSLPDCSAHGSLQTKILEWVAIPFSRGSSRPKDWTWVSCITDRFFTISATWEAPGVYTVSKNKTWSWLWLRPRVPYCQIQA